MAKTTRTQAATAIAGAFLPVERGAQDLALKGALCLALALEQQAKARVAPHVGADVLEQIAEGNLYAVRAAGAMARAHHAMTVVRDELGLEVFVGPDCPPNQGSLHDAAVVSLRAAG